jgi:hypothetical protein
MSKALELADALDAIRIDPSLCHHMVAPDVDAAAAELRRLAEVEAAARNLVKVKGRYHTEQAFKALQDALGATK